jgi:hypothetical protein
MADQTLALPQKATLKERAVGEFKRLLVIFLYLWAVFGLLAIHSSMVLYQRQMDYGDHTLAIVNAFVFAKVLLIGEHFNLGTRFNSRPLIYPILHKCLIFTVLFIVFHLVESVVIGVWRGHTIVESIPPMLGWNPRGVLSTALIGFVVLLPFFGFREIVRVVGRKEMRALLFEPRTSDPTLK